MPFIPLFIVIGVFLAMSKVLKPNHESVPSAYEGYDQYDEQTLLNQALIDYIARESMSKSDPNYGNKSQRKSSYRSGKRDSRSQLSR